MSTDEASGVAIIGAQEVEPFLRFRLDPSVSSRQSPDGSFFVLLALATASTVSAPLAPPLGTVRSRGA